MCYSIDAQAEMFVRFRTLKTTQKKEEEARTKVFSGQDNKGVRRMPWH